MMLPLMKLLPSTLTAADTAKPTSRASTRLALRMNGLPNSSIRMMRQKTWQGQRYRQQYMQRWRGSRSGADPNRPPM